MLGIEQRSVVKRLLVSLPLFALGIGIAFIDFDVIWRYFAWSNQALSVITLWMITAWLSRKHSNYVMLALIPAMIMTYVCSAFVFVSNQFLGMGSCNEAYVYAAALTAIIAGLMMLKIRKDVKSGLGV
jgi:carbon starvation protein CstA